MEKIKNVFKNYFDKIKNGDIKYILFTIFGLWLEVFIHMGYDGIVNEISWTGWENLMWFDYIFLAPGMALLVIGVPILVGKAIWNSIKSLF